MTTFIDEDEVCPNCDELLSDCVCDDELDDLDDVDDLEADDADED